MNVESRAHRILRPMSRYTPAERIRIDQSALPECTEGEKIVGIFRNHEDTLDSALLITTIGVHIRTDLHWQLIRYEDIKDIQFPESKSTAEYLTIDLPNSSQRLLPVHRGKDGSTSDLFEIMRFLKRATKDIQKK